MINDYESQKASIISKCQLSSTDSPSGYAEARGPWKSKERQSRLFNTAPVFSPDGGLARAGNEKVGSELQNLERVSLKNARQRI